MTIDEAIAHAREVAKASRYKAKTYDDDLLKRFLTSKEKEEQLAEEHEQLAEWLEELKETRKGFEENRQAGYVYGYSYGYNEGVDEFTDWMFERYSTDLAEYVECWRDEMAVEEQYKGGE